MKQLITLHNQDFDPDAPHADPSGYPYREAARAVVFDGPKVALLYVAKQHYYKLPGGGIESGETTIEALEREVLEEIGCRITAIRELGETLEYKDQAPERQRSLCFTAKIVGKSVPPTFTDDELADEFAIVWADNLDAAIQLARGAHPDNISGQFIQHRDVAILQAAHYA